MLAHKAPMVPRLARLISFILPTPPVAITDAFIDPGEVPVGNGQSVLGVPLPGHTPGSFGYVYDGVLFTGDTLELSHDHLQLATGPFTVDPAAERRSVAALGRELRGVKIDFVCTGHQGCTRAGEAPRLLAELIARSGKSQ
jgi:glyoxylase-like metal-dependent hydrolase (beta-lactamase superfamily II)